jgi:hypothetical protein
MNNSAPKINPQKHPNGGMHDSIFIRIWGEKGGGEGRVALAQYAHGLGVRSARMAAPVGMVVKATFGEHKIIVPVGDISNLEIGTRVYTSSPEHAACEDYDMELAAAVTEVMARLKDLSQADVDGQEKAEARGAIPRLLKTFEALGVRVNMKGE